jgi:hypothetical protein
MTQSRSSRKPSTGFVVADVAELCSGNSNSDSLPAGLDFFHATRSQGIRLLSPEILSSEEILATKLGNLVWNFSPR